MISNIKDKRKENDVDELSEQLRNTEIIIQQGSNIIFKKNNSI